MHIMHLSGIDLNLLVVLDALLSSGSLTLASKRIGLSQSATSHALARLRTTLSDPLFLREGRRLVPTARALALRAPLREALGTIEASLGEAEVFEPKTASRTFHVATSDYAELVLLPPLLERIAALAPRIDLWVQAWNGTTRTPSLASGDTELVIAPLGTGFDAGLEGHRRTLFEERFVCIARKNHPRLRKKPITLATWLELPHALIAPNGARGGVVDSALRERGLERRIALAVPHFLVAPHAVAHSDLVLTVAERVARSFARSLPLMVFAPPIPLQGFRMDMHWHSRLDRDPGLTWLRSTIVDVANDL